jgi:hypothetical protein
MTHLAPKKAVFKPNSGIFLAVFAPTLGNPLYQAGSEQVLGI